MGLIQRLITLSLGNKQHKEKQQNKKKKIRSPVLQVSQSTTYPNQDQAAVNRLLRSSSTRFSVLSEIEYRSLPPIPHPINNFLREPSIISTQTTSTVNTYTVTIHQRTVHSRTEFPNANGTASLLSTPSKSPQRRSHRIPPLTPGDQTRLETLRRDPSVLSLLTILDEFGHPNLKAFENTPARRRRVSTFKMLLGEQEPVKERSIEIDQESDLSWAERCLQKVQNGSSDSLPLLCSLGMADDLFMDDLSDIKSADGLMNTSITPESSIVDSLGVELGAAENGIRTPKSVLKEDSLFQFLFDGDICKNVDEEPVVSQAAPLRLSVALQTVPQPPRGPRAMGESEPPPRPRFTVRDGPQVKQTQLSLSPKKQRPQPLPPIPPDFQFRPVRFGLSKANPLGYPAPTEEWESNDLRTGVIPSGMTNRSVPVASSVYLQIETMPPLLSSLPSVLDLYTPIPLNRPMEGRHKCQDVHVRGQCTPPGAPLKPTKSELRSLSKGPRKYRWNDKPGRAQSLAKEKSASQVVRSKAGDSDKENDNLVPRTPEKSLVFTLKAERPSLASSYELSSHGRRVMEAVRTQLRRSPRRLNPLTDDLNTMTAVLP